MGRKKTSRTMPVIENMVVQLDTGGWGWKKGGLRKFRQDSKRALCFTKDVEATRDCIARACESTW